MAIIIYFQIDYNIGKGDMFIPREDKRQKAQDKRENKKGERRKEKVY